MPVPGTWSRIIHGIRSGREEPKIRCYPLFLWTGAPREPRRWVGSPGSARDSEGDCVVSCQFQLPTLGPTNSNLHRREVVAQCCRAGKRRTQARSAKDQNTGLLEERGQESCRFGSATRLVCALSLARIHNPPRGQTGQGHSPLTDRGSGCRTSALQQTATATAPRRPM